MTRPFLRCVAAGALLPLAALVLDAQAVPRADSLLATDTFTIASKPLGESRRINVHVPAGYAGLFAPPGLGANAPARYPVLYMPDGGLDEDFPHVVRTVDSLIALGRIRPVIVVGIPNTERRRDLTGPTRFKTDSAIAKHVGGSAAFRQFIREELIPAVNARFRTTGERGIVGESLAGLFIVETFLTEPELFQHYVALDPSLWWNGGSLMERAPTLIAAFPSAPRSIYLASANVPDIVFPTAHLAQMLEKAQPRGLTFTYSARPDLTHGTIFAGVGPVALEFALK